MSKLMMMTLSVLAILTGSAAAQTVNNAPQYSPAGVQDQTKQAPEVGDPAQVGGTPAGNIKGAQSQLQDPLAPRVVIVPVPPPPRRQ